MKSGKWLNLWRVVLLGAIGGLFSSALYLMVSRAEEYFAELSYQEELAREALNPHHMIACRFNLWNPLWWVNASCWNIVLFIVASLLVHRYLTRRVKSVFLLWQCVGLTVIAGWGLTILLGTILEGYLRKGEFPLETILEGMIFASNQVNAFKFVTLMLGINVIYGTMAQVSGGYYRSSRIE